MLIGAAACGHSTTMSHSDGPASSAPGAADTGATDHSAMDHSATDPTTHSMEAMDLGPQDEAFDLRFIDGMVLHHQGAIAMAEQVLEKSERPELKQLAEEIIAAQQQEISQMQQWRQAWYPTAAATPMMYDAAMGHMMPMSAEMAAAMKMDVGLGQADDQFDQRFLTAMIVHHEGALVMAEQALERSDRAELQQLAQAILASQQAEIEQMRQWQQAWYGQS